MVIRNRLFPYPVLCDDTDDYVSGSFYVETELIGEGLNDIQVRFNFHLDNGELKSLISRGKAQYVIHIECSRTAFRTVVKTFSDTVDYRIMNSKVNGDISLLAMIVSTEKIPFYKNSALNEDYNDVDILIEKASILSYYNMQPIIVNKNYEELAEQESIFSIVKVPRHDEFEEKTVDFNLENNKIQILVDEDVYNSYIKYQNNTSMRPFIMAVLVMPALTHMVEQLRNNWELCDSYSSYQWFIRISKFYELQGKNFIEEVVESEEYISKIVQEMLKFPISSAIVNIPVMLGE